jgi:hypothetical protein
VLREHAAAAVQRLWGQWWVGAVRRKRCSRMCAARQRAADVAAEALAQSELFRCRATKLL